MSRYLKIGELADATGVTVRTLHYYDEVGLLKPVLVTEAGHRLYDIQSITGLYRIIAMKDMGFSLDEIKEFVTTKDIKIPELIEIQLYRVQEEIANKQILFSKLLKLKNSIQSNNDVSLEDFQEMLQFINLSADKYFTSEQFDRLKENKQVLSEESEIGSEWIAFISKLQNCYNKNLPKTDSSVQECIEFWKRITIKLIGNDKQMENSVLAFHSSPESNQMKYGLNDDIYQYLMTLII